MREGSRGPGWGLLCAAALTVTSLPVSAQQDPESLTETCSTQTAESLCREQVLGLQAAQAAVGLLVAGSAQVPGGASTLGRRFGGMPRMAASLRTGLLHAQRPSPSNAPASTPWESVGSTAFALQGSFALGLFEGFSLLPTVGGLLSVDVLGVVGATLLPGGGGFQNDPRFAGLGVRLGLLRESFTLPGLTLSASRRWIGEVELQSEPGLQATLDPTVSSLRVMAGKDLLALGILGGMGWDRYQSNGEFRQSVCDPGFGDCPVTEFHDFRSDRVLFFGGVSLNFLLLQLSAEGGWARGFANPVGRPAEGYDPGAGTVFLSGAARLTL